MSRLKDKLHRYGWLILSLCILLPALPLNAGPVPVPVPAPAPVPVEPVFSLPQVCTVQPVLPQPQFKNAPPMSYWVVKCITGILDNAVTRNKFINIVRFIYDAIAAVIVIAIILFGLKIITGNLPLPRLSGETMIMIVKTVLILAVLLTGGLMDFFNAAKQITLGLASIAVNLSNAGVECNFVIVNRVYNPDWMWNRIDCLFMSFLGGKVDAAGQISFDSSALRIGTGVATTPLGIIIIGFIVFGVFVLLLGFITAIFVYLASLIAIAILFLFGPIFLPFFIFSPQNPLREYFNRWAYSIVGFILQPMLLFAYLVFMLNAMVFALYGPTGTLARPEKGTLIASYKKMETALTPPGNAVDMAEVWSNAMSKLQETVSPAAGDWRTYIRRQRGLMQGAFELPAIAWNPEAPRDPARLAVEEFVVMLIATAVIAYLLLTFMYAVIHFAGAIAGVPGANNELGRMFNMTQAMGIIKRAAGGK